MPMSHFSRPLIQNLERKCLRFSEVLFFLQIMGSIAVTKQSETNILTVSSCFSHRVSNDSPKYEVPSETKQIDVTLLLAGF